MAAGKRRFETARPGLNDLTEDLMEDMTTAALQYAELKGWPVFPVSKDKRPLVAKGFHSASRDPRMIREWWRVNPDAGVALAVPEGVLVVDVDPRNGGSLPAGLPDTRTARTVNGGTHAYFVVPPGLSFVGHAGPGVDLKAPGKGYVILPRPRATPGSGRARWHLPNDVLQSWTRSEPPGNARTCQGTCATCRGRTPPPTGRAPCGTRSRPC